ncbi:tannase/feruloyl esterase family alpha/beta hydrolase [Polyangium aurulentum]|uniref:tannase/feruloyl esterase family alpha/beta hydrolase n=1 Tax=Polyangium aurulentum TaxID=2567896 RepID=UPI00146CD59D|nr:tannase/feruloyl esterase family alpha/beta hydrolase [Polyangium aurulentum]UQA59829.1 tannase/feruloyl esterase family alpha/beta hydrolase [Polyangium aurulentum]
MKISKHRAAYHALLGALTMTLLACGDDGQSPPGADAGADADTPVKTPQEACDALAGVTIGEAKLSEPTLVAAANGIGEHCKVTGLMGTSLRFELYLPTEWNKKLLYAGGGGWDGSIPTGILRPWDTSGGYVTVASNGGHDDPTGAVFLNNPEVKKDFGYLQIHKVLGAVQAIVEERYGEGPARKYFEGCSNGGREALIQATRWPEDFDGVVARAPAYSFTELMLAFNNNMKHMLGTPGGEISAAKAATITSAVLEKCDALDGIADGVVSNVAACAFDPASLLCPAGDSDTCLTQEQIKTAQAIYGEFKLPDGTSIYPGWGPGGEGDFGGFPPWLIAIPGMVPVPLQMSFAEAIIRNWFLSDPSYDTFQFEPEKHSAEIEQAADILDASTDLKAFFARKGKLILVHGTNDWAISYKGSIKYWNGVAESVGGEAARDASMEFFLQPGVQHCWGGSGADTVDLVSALSSWVEEGKPPSSQSIVSSKLDMAGAVQFQRPLCEYPDYPRYNGSGDPNAAASYTCTKP